MKTNQNIESEIEKTMACLENLPKAKADAFFYTRLSVKLQSRNEPTLLRWFFETPYLKPALLMLFVALNVGTLIMLVNTKTSESAVASVTDTFMKEYELNDQTDNYLVLNEE